MYRLFQNREIQESHPNDNTCSNRFRSVESCQNVYGTFLLQISLEILGRENFEFFETDTDSIYIALAEDTLLDSVKPDM